MTELTALLRSLRHQHIIQRRHAESLIGKLSFAAQVLPGARPFMRRMLDSVHACSSRRRAAPIHIDAGFRSDVRFWLQHFSTWNGRQQWRSARARPFVFASDASLHGFASISSPHLRLRVRYTHHSSELSMQTDPSISLQIWLPPFRRWPLCPSTSGSGLRSAGATPRNMHTSTIRILR